MLRTAGQAGDNPALAPLLETYRVQSKEAFRLLGDKAYSHPSTRARLRRLRIPHTIPERSDQIDLRKAKGSRGGRPPAFDADTYRHRNTVERGFNRLKHWRGIATRYDKYALTYLGGVTLAALVTYHRVRLADTTKLGRAGQTEARNACTRSISSADAPGSYASSEESAKRCWSPG